MNSYGTAAIASRCRPVRIQVLDRGRGLARTPSGPPARCRSSAPGCPSRRRRARRTARIGSAQARGSAPTTSGTVGTTSKSVAGSCRPGPGRPRSSAELLGGELGCVEDRQPAVGDLPGQLEVLRARPRPGRSGGPLADRRDGQLQRLAGPVRQRQPVVLAVVARPSSGPARDRTIADVLPGPGQRPVEPDAVPALRHLRSGDPEPEPEPAARSAGRGWPRSSPSSPGSGPGSASPPTRSRSSSVWAASQASTVGLSDPYASAAQTTSNPSSSACRASRS